MGNTPSLSSKAEALAIVYVQTHADKSTTASELAEMYLCAKKEITAYFSSHSKSAEITPISGGL